MTARRPGAPGETPAWDLAVRRGRSSARARVARLRAKSWHIGQAALAAGAVKTRLDAVVVGGAAMFKLNEGSGQDIGARNEAAVRAGLVAAGIPVRAAATGGDRGRTVRVTLADQPTVVSREAGGTEQLLLGREAVLA